MLKNQSANAYQFVTTDHGHDAKRLDPVLLRIEGRTGAVVSEDDIGVEFGVEVGDANIIVCDGVFEACNRLSVTAAAASSIFTGATLLTIAIDIHVDKLLAVTVQIDYARCMIFAISEC